jgi:hypothetical protein
MWGSGELDSAWPFVPESNEVLPLGADSSESTTIAHGHDALLQTKVSSQTKIRARNMLPG